MTSSWPTTRKRPSGRHSSLLTGEDPGPELPPDGGWFPPDLTAPAGGGEAGKAYWASLEGGTRVSIRGQDSTASDTVVLGELGLFRRPPPGIGLDRPVPERPWYRRRGPVLSLALGLVIVAVTAILATPPLLAVMGVGAQACPQCRLPIPSTAAIGPASPAMSAPASHPARPAAPAPSSAPARTSAPPAPPVVAPQPMETAPPPVTATYTAAGSGGADFTGQVTVVNQSAAPVTGWHLVVALPGDQVSAVQNAEFNDDNDVLFMSPAPADLTIAPGASVTVTIYASGPDWTPAECSFDNVACR
ncbi:MAG TPA: cellulose binding domain-containing protein [Streptosporangiaceae bacterium]